MVHGTVSGSSPHFGPTASCGDDKEGDCPQERLSNPVQRTTVTGSKADPRPLHLPCGAHRVVLYSGKLHINVVFLRLSVARVWRLAFVFLLAMLCTSCGGNVQPNLTYQPEYLPVQLSLSPSGISIQGTTSLVTAIGVFSIGARYSLPLPNRDSIYVILRSRRAGYDHIFEVRTGADQFSAIVNGTTSISVSNDQVLIDVTAGSIKRITFKRVNVQIAERGNTSWPQREWHKAEVRWNEGWSQSWYKPFALTRWAYSDSTIARWYGIGFVWFLLRLVLAIVLFFIDTVLSFGFLLGQIGFVFFGPTGRDVIYGLLVLSVIIGSMMPLMDTI